MIGVTHFMRRPGPGRYSLERLYDDVRQHLPRDIDVAVHRSRFESRGVWRRLYDILAATSYQNDVNHVTGDANFLTFCLAKRRTVLTILDCGILDRLNGLRRWIVWLFWFWLPARRSAAIVTISSAAKRELLRHLRCDPAKINVIHCSVSSEFSPRPKAFNSERPRVLQIGVTDNKNLARVVEAIRGLRCELVIVGRPSAVQIEMLAKSGVEYTVRADLSRESLVAQYEESDIVLFASTYEGFGLPIVEANAVGRPVVTSNLLSMPEVAGDAACLVDPYDVKSIRAGIRRVIEDAAYRDELVRRGFSNAERFNVGFIAEQYAGLYRAIWRMSQTRQRGNVRPE